MRKSRYTEAQITNAINASETGIKVKEICSELGISEATFYSWKKKFAGLSTEDGRKINELDEKVKLLTRELQLVSADKDMLQSMVKHFFTTNDKRQAVNFLKDSFKIGTRRSCRLMDISRSVYHYPANSDQ